MLSQNWAPLFRKGNVDLVISGHTHSHSWQPPNPQTGGYALFVGSNQEIETIKVTEKAIEIDAQSLSGDRRQYQVPLRAGSSAKRPK
jgi:UDP-2,3-diacylglucosamine pyrophosphatase LpxH